MSLYYVKHQHNPETCPAKDPDMGAMLLSHLSPRNAGKYGITIFGDAVLNGQHTLIMIVDAAEQAKVEEFMSPFRQAGPVEVVAASNCEAVVERGGC